MEFHRSNINLLTIFDYSSDGGYYAVAASARGMLGRLAPNEGIAGLAGFRAMHSQLRSPPRKQPLFVFRFNLFRIKKVGSFFILFVVNLRSAEEVIWSYESFVTV